MSHLSSHHMESFYGQKWLLDALNFSLSLFAEAWAPYVLAWWYTLLWPLFFQCLSIEDSLFCSLHDIIKHVWYNTKPTGCLYPGLEVFTLEQIQIDFHCFQNTEAD